MAVVLIKMRKKPIMDLKFKIIKLATGVIEGSE